MIGLTLAFFPMPLAGQADTEARVYLLEVDPPFPGAQVRIDGSSVGATDGAGKILIQGVQPGTHQVSIQLLGKACGIQEAYFDPDLNSLGRLPLQCALRTLDTNVAGAEVWVDGIRVGHTSEPDARLELVLPVGRPSVIRIAKPGFADVQHVLTVATAGKGITVLHLVPSPLPVRSSSSPSGALFLVLGAVVLTGAIAVWRRTRSGRRPDIRPSAIPSTVPGATPPTIFDRYAISGALGRGGVATIHLARDVTTGESVALKILDPDWLGDAEMVQKFLSEAEALRRIHALEPSAPVVRVLRSGREGGRLDGIPFLALELLEGETLAEQVRRSGPLSEEDVRAIGVQLASCLETVHAAGIIHRDLSPDNVMVVLTDGSPRVTLFDFGIARQEALGDGALELSVTGKPWFISPEQCRGEPLDGRSDLYSLGVLLHVVRTGHPPGDGVPLDAPEISQGLREVLNGLLAERREDWPASAARAAEQLRAADPSPSSGIHLTNEENFGTWRM